MSTKAAFFVRFSPGCPTRSLYTIAANLRLMKTTLSEPGYGWRGHALLPFTSEPREGGKNSVATNRHGSSTKLVELEQTVKFRLQRRFGRKFTASESVRVNISAKISRSIFDLLWWYSDSFTWAATQRRRRRRGCAA